MNMGHQFKTFVVDEAYFNNEDIESPEVNLQRRWQTSQVIRYQTGTDPFTKITIAIRNGKCINMCCCSFCLI